MAQGATFVSSATDDVAGYESRVRLREDSKVGTYAFPACQKHRFGVMVLVHLSSVLVSLECVYLHISAQPVPFPDATSPLSLGPPGVCAVQMSTIAVCDKSIIRRA